MFFQFSFPYWDVVDNFMCFAFAFFFLGLETVLSIILEFAVDTLTRVIS